MATLAQLQQALANPNTRKMLDLLSYTEGTMRNGYFTAFGGGRLQNLADHPRYSMGFTQTDGKRNTTSAAGRYQFIKGTWDGLARQYGFRDFGPQSQDLGAVALLAQNGALPYVLKGDWSNAIARSGRTWASLPSSTYAQPTKSWQKVQAFLGGKISIPQQPMQPRQTAQPARHYLGDIPPDQAAALLGRTVSQKQWMGDIPPTQAASILGRSSQPRSQIQAPSQQWLGDIPPDQAAAILGRG